MANATPFQTRSPKTIVVYPINGQTEFTIPFEFLARKFVVVTLLGVDRVPLVLNTDYRFVSVNRIQLLSQVSAGYPNIELRRVTSSTDRLVDFHDGSILRAYDLNLAQIQTMHVAEEARDLTADNIGVNDNGDLDARNRKIVNLANGTDPNDAVNLGQLRQFDTSTANNAERAEAAKNRAVQAETNTARDSASAAVNATKSVASAGTAVQAASDANRSYEKIVPLEQSTVANAQVATQQAQRAKNEADRAKSEADKLANINQFAQTIHSVDGSQPNFKATLGIGLETNHAYMEVYSQKDTESSPSRKGFVGVSSANSVDMTFGSDTGAAVLKGAGTYWSVLGSHLWTNGEKMSMNHLKVANQSYIDLWGKSKVLRLYSDDNRGTILKQNQDGTGSHNFVSFIQHDSTRGTVQFDTNNVSANMYGSSSWQTSTTKQNAGLFASNAVARDGHAYAAVSASYTGRTVGWPTNIGFGTLSHNSSTLLSPYIWATGMDINHNRIWEFDVYTGRLKWNSQPEGVTRTSLNQIDFAPNGAPSGSVGTDGLGMIQWRYGYATYSGAGSWQGINYSRPFPTATLAVLLTEADPNRADNTWNGKVGSLSTTGFNMLSGVNERNWYYLAIGY